MNDINPDDIKELYSTMEDFNVSTKKASRELVKLARSLGEIANQCIDKNKKKLEVIQSLVKIHLQISKIHTSLGKDFGILKDKYEGIRKKNMELTMQYTTSLDKKRKLFKEMAGKVEKGEKVEDGDKVLWEVLEDYNYTVQLLIKMREIDSKLNSVFYDFSEVLGKIDGISTMIKDFSDMGEKQLREYERKEVWDYIR